MKRTVCLVVALLMLLASSALAAPNSEIVGSAVIEKHNFGASGLTELPIVDPNEKVTFVLWKPLNSTVMESYDECILYEEMEARTGIHVDWVYPPVGSETENFNLRVASFDLPHMFIEANNRYTGGLDKAIEDGIYLPLTEYYNKGLTPNYKYLRDTYPDIAIDTMQDSGELAVFWQFDYVGTSPWSGMWIRSDWLQECGLEEPVFVEDWTNILRTFKEKYGAVMGIQIGALGAGGGDLDTHHGFFSTYGVAFRWFQIDGKVHFGPVMEGFKQAIELLAGWYKEGLIDPNFASYDWNGYTAKTSDAVSYGVYGSNYGEIGQMKRTSQAINPNWSIIPVNGPVLTEGQKLHLRNTDFLTRNQYDPITTRAKDEGVDEIIMKWKDYWYSQEGGDLCSYGVEGKSYEWDENNHLVWTYESFIDMQDGALDFWTVYPLFKLHNGGYLRDSSSYVMDQLVWDCIAKWSEIEPDWFMPMTRMTAQESQDHAAIYTSINDYINEQTGLYITGQQDLSTWDTFVKTIYDMGIEECMEIQQDALDRYFARSDD